MGARPLRGAVSDKHHADSATWWCESRFDNALKRGDESVAPVTLDAKALALIGVLHRIDFEIEPV